MSKKLINPECLPIYFQEVDKSGMFADLFLRKEVEKPECLLIIFQKKKLKSRNVCIFCQIRGPNWA